MEPGRALVITKWFYRSRMVAAPEMASPPGMAGEVPPHRVGVMAIARAMAGGKATAMVGLGARAAAGGGVMAMGTATAAGKNER